MSILSEVELLALFRSQFPKFAAVDDVTVSSYLAGAILQLAVDRFGDQVNLAVMLLAADEMVQDGIGDLEEVEIANARAQGLSSFKSGNVTVNLAPLPEGSRFSPFGENRYGIRLARLARKAAFGPNVIRTTPTTSPTATTPTTPDTGLPTLPAGTSFTTAPSGAYLLAPSGAYLVVPA